MAPKQIDPQFKLRMTPEIKAAIARAASQNNRSMNAEILARLQSSFLSGSSMQADPNDIELIDVLNEIEQLKLKVTNLRR